MNEVVSLLFLFGGLTMKKLWMLGGWCLLCLGVLYQQFLNDLVLLASFLGCSALAVEQVVIRLFLFLFCFLGCYSGIGVRNNNTSSVKE